MSGGAAPATTVALLGSVQETGWRIPQNQKIPLAVTVERYSFGSSRESGGTVDVLTEILAAQALVIRQGGNSTSILSSMAQILEFSRAVAERLDVQSHAVGQGEVQVAKRRVFRTGQMPSGVERSTATSSDDDR
jgi:hypothetical protein